MKTRIEKNYQIEAVQGNGATVIYVHNDKDWQLDDHVLSCHEGGDYLYETLQDAEDDFEEAKKIFFEQHKNCLGFYKEIRIVENINILTQEDDDDDFEYTDFEEKIVIRFHNLRMSR